MTIEAKKILFVTGTRADYGKLNPLAIEAYDQGFDITYFVTGMHMMQKYGLTKKEVQRNTQFNVIEFLNQREGDAQETILAKTINGFSDYLKEINPDMVVIHGDRIEAIACSLVCATNYTLSVHIEGGELSGTIDEILRHCNTKLCSFHMVSSIEAKRRVIQLGESDQNVFVIGSPELDIHLRDSGVSISQVRERYDIKTDDYGICIFHPVTSETQSIGQQSIDLFKALTSSRKYFVVIQPNNDPGNIEITNVIKSLDKDQFRVIPSMRFNYFSELMKNSSIFIGNSSAGVREAPFIGIPSIDVGTRQKNRAMAKSVYKCEASEIEKIVELIYDNWNKRSTRDPSYGDGDAAKKFVDVLKNKQLWRIPLQKYFKETQ